jgi:hypothetical protein
MTVQALYRIKLANGRVDYAGEKWIALARARELVGAPSYASESELKRDWGATIANVPDRSPTAPMIGMIEKKV